MSNLTKQALLAAFGQLLEKKPFNKITVGDITELCGVNRMTFYYHFQDIYELMIWGLETHVLNVDKSCTTYEHWQEGYLKIYRFALEHQIYITKIFQTVKQEHLEHHLLRIVTDMVPARSNSQSITNIFFIKLSRFRLRLLYRSLGLCRRV